LKHIDIMSALPSVTSAGSPAESLVVAAAATASASAAVAAISSVDGSRGSITFPIMNGPVDWSRWQIPDDAFVVIGPYGSVRSFQDLDKMLADNLGFPDAEDSLRDNYDSMEICDRARVPGALLHLQGVSAQTNYYDDFIILGNLVHKSVVLARIQELWCFPCSHPA